MKHFKQVLKYILIFTIGFISGFCIMYKLANDVVAITRDYIWAYHCYTYNLGLLNDSTTQIMEDSINTPDGLKYKAVLDKYIEVTPMDKNCYDDGDNFYLFGYR